MREKFVSFPSELWKQYGNSKNINEATFKKQLSITLFSDLVFKHENIKLLIDYYYNVSNYVACFKPWNWMLLM